MEGFIYRTLNNPGKEPYKKRQRMTGHLSCYVSMSGKCGNLGARVDSTFTESTSTESTSKARHSGFSGSTGVGGSAQLVRDWLDLSPHVNLASVYLLKVGLSQFVDTSCPTGLQKRDPVLMQVISTQGLPSLIGNASPTLLHILVQLIAQTGRALLC